MSRTEAAVCNNCRRVALKERGPVEDWAPPGWFDLYRAEEDGTWDVSGNWELCSRACVLAVMARLELEAGEHALTAQREG